MKPSISRVWVAALEYVQCSSSNPTSSSAKGGGAAESSETADSVPKLGAVSKACARPPGRGVAGTADKGVYDG